MTTSMPASGSVSPGSLCFMQEECALAECVECHWFIHPSVHTREECEWLKVIRREVCALLSAFVKWGADAERMIEADPLTWEEVEPQLDALMHQINRERIQRHRQARKKRRFPAYYCRTCETACTPEEWDVKKKQCRTCAGTEGG